MGAGPLLRALAVLALLAGCADKTPQSDSAALLAGRFVSSDPPSITLTTHINNRTGEGAHSALIINGPERVVFNPAGSWHHPLAPEQGDLHVGFSPAMERWFFDYHARETFRIRAQTVEVPPEVAARAIELARARGSVAPTFCTLSIVQILRELPGFETVPLTLFPMRASRAFAELPGVETRLYVDDSPDDWSDLDLEFND